MSDPQPSEANANNPEAEAAAPPAKRKIELGSILIILVVLGFFAENAAMMWFYKPWAHGMPSPADIQKAEATPAPEDAAPKRRRGPLAIYQLQPFLVNLADSEHHRYAKAVIALGFGAAEGLEEIDTNKVLIASSRQTVMESIGSRTAETIVTLEGKAALRAELLERLNELPFPMEVDEIYITEFLVQF